MRPTAMLQPLRIPPQACGMTHPLACSSRIGNAMLLANVIASSDPPQLTSMLDIDVYALSVQTFQPMGLFPSFFEFSSSLGRAVELPEEELERVRSRFLDQIRKPLSTGIEALADEVRALRSPLPQIKCIHPSFRPYALRHALEYDVAKSAAIHALGHSIMTYLERTIEDQDLFFALQRLKTLTSVLALGAGLTTLHKIWPLTPPDSLPFVLAVVQGDSLSRALETARDLYGPLLVSPAGISTVGFLATFLALTLWSPGFLQEQPKALNEGDLLKRRSHLQQLLREYAEAFPKS